MKGFGKYWYRVVDTEVGFFNIKILEMFANFCIFMLLMMRNLKEALCNVAKFLEMKNSVFVSDGRDPRGGKANKKTRNLFILMFFNYCWNHKIVRFMNKFGNTVLLSRFFFYYQFLQMYRYEK